MVKKILPKQEPKPGGENPSQARVATLAVDELRDFSADRRLLLVGTMALVTGTAGAAAAWVLIKLIALATNLAYFGRLSAATVPIAGNTLGLAAALVPVAGCLIIGLMARYGSEKIRGHGIPEAM